MPNGAAGLAVAGRGLIPAWEPNGTSTRRTPLWTVRRPGRGGAQRAGCDATRRPAVTPRASVQLAQSESDGYGSSAPAEGTPRDRAETDYADAMHRAQHPNHRGAGLA